jgi:hypothetical protein
MTLENEKWSLPSPTLVMECIEKWRNLDLRKLSDNYIDKELSDFLDKLGTYTVPALETTPFKLWRLRKFNYLFKSTNEFWEPPKEKTPLGRCNAPGSPVLYTSEDIETPFEELNVKENEQVYGIKYEVTEKLNLKRIVPKNFIATDSKGNSIYDDTSMLRDYKITNIPF